MGARTDRHFVETRECGKVHCRTHTWNSSSAMSDRAGILDHEEIEAIEETLAGRTAKLAALLRHKYPLSREMREHISAMLVDDANSTWCLVLKRKTRGRPSADQLPRLRPLTRTRQALIASMLDGTTATAWTLDLRRRK